MCGGVIFPYKPQYEEELAKLYPSEEVEQFKRTSQVRSLYWQRGEPVLPVILQEDGEGPSEETLMRWGNRDKDKPFPQTGWARTDSIGAGKWDYLEPQSALIPVTYGVEKGKWFPIEHGIEGVVVKRGGERRVYMLTDQATPDFLEATRHDRMPVLQDQDEFRWLGGEPVGTDSASIP